MEIDARLPAIQTSKVPDDGTAGREPAPLPQATAGSEFFISPVLRFDSRSLTVIFQVRDSRSGDVIRQFPPEAVVARYRQDPSARPFVLPSTSVNDDSGSELDLAATPAGPDGASAPGAPPATTDRRSSPPQAPSGDPVDLVA